MNAVDDKSIFGGRLDLGRLLLSFLIAAVTAYVVQSLPISLRDLLLHSRVYTGPELGTMEVVVGFIHSLVVTAVCLLILRRPIIQIASASIAAQILWVEWAYGFRQGGQTFAETLLRYAEHVGVLLGAALAATAYVKLFTKKGAP